LNQVITQARPIVPEGVEVESNGWREILPADTVVLTTGVRPNRDLEEAMKRLSIAFNKVGDCVEPRKAIDAIHEGFKVALNL
jgi:NADH dehydrogenase FAD-containing subunit